MSRIIINLTLAKDVRKKKNCKDVRNKKNCKGIEILLIIKKKKRTMYQKINLKN